MLVSNNDREREGMQLTGHAAEQLSGERMYVMSREGREVVVLEEIVDTHSEKLGDQTYVVTVVEPM